MDRGVLSFAKVCVNPELSLAESSQYHYPRTTLACSLFPTWDSIEARGVLKSLPSWPAKSLAISCPPCRPHAFTPHV